MSEFETNWSMEEFKVYLLLYCAFADYEEALEEKEMISKYLDEGHVEMMLEELKSDNDYQSIQKIVTTAQKFFLSKEEVEQTLKEISDLFNADGKFDILEQNLFRGIKRLLEHL